MIALSVKDNVIPYIVSINEPDVCWKTLKDLYANGTNFRKLMLRRKLANLKMDEGNSMPTFLQQVRELVNEFACVGEFIDDAELVEHTLMTLPDSFKGLVNSVMYRTALPSFTELTVILLQDDLTHELKGSNRAVHKALPVKAPGKGPATRRSEDSRSKQKKTRSCHYCGGRDHWMCNCHELAVELKRRRASRSEKPSINLIDNFGSGESDSSDEFPEVILEQDLAVNLTKLNIACSSQHKKNAEWFLDSGASRHVTGQKQLLIDLEEANQSSISTTGGEKLHVA